MSTIPTKKKKSKVTQPKPSQLEYKILKLLRRTENSYTVNSLSSSLNKTIGDIKDALATLLSDGFVHTWEHDNMTFYTDKHVFDRMKKDAEESIEKHLADEEDLVYFG